MSRTRLWTMAGAVLAASVLANAQWLNHPTPGIPRMPDGKPNLTAPAPRTADGKADFSGQWQTESAPREILRQLLPDGNGAGGEAPSQYFLNVLEDFKPGQSPLLPSVEAEYRKHTKDFTKDSPVSHCLPTGIPLVVYAPAPFKIVQTPGLIVMIYERDTTFRQVYMDGRKLPVDPQPAFMGYSIGRWDGDTLVIETVGLNDRAWLDARGHTHSDALKLTERIRRIDFGHMETQMTMDDPKTFAKPVTITLKQRYQADTDLLESYCTENERDAVHYR